MAYTVLARKWRPRSFEQLIGQEHVLRALVNALDSQRLHHAYLFTGTRGVGKTTIARVLAKALNCERGISSKPCGECQACVDVDQGRFLDLLEVDAASRTKVDDTRELLDNVQYAPVRGRFKIYLIDEVHMLSTHSFNALLKTLEEPPPHVKFLLATTDPKKLPVTVLSRCLQFPLKRLPAERIATHLAQICAAEEIPAEPAALTSIATAAQGSVRDALSLLDQAIAHGGGRVAAADVAGMLGLLEREPFDAILAALAAQDGVRVLAETARLDELTPEYDAALGELAGLLQRIAVLQIAGDAALPGGGDAVLRTLSQQLTPADVQLFYQIALQGRQEMAWAADARAAFEMTLLRMLAFRPAGDAAESSDVSAEREASPVPAAERRQPAGKTSPGAERVGSGAAVGTATGANAAPPRPSRGALPPIPAPPSSLPAAPRTPAAPGVRDAQPDPGDDWARWIAQARLTGAVLQLARHCALRERRENRFHLLLDAQGTGMDTPGMRAKLEQAFSELLGSPVQLVIETAGAQPLHTPAREQAQQRDARLQQAARDLAADPTVRALEQTFGAKLQPDSIKLED